jgi:hypothetical protein
VVKLLVFATFTTPFISIHVHPTNSHSFHSFILFTVGAGRHPKLCCPPSVHPFLTYASRLLRQSRHIQSPTPRSSPQAAQTRMIAGATHNHCVPNITFQPYFPGIRLLFVLQTVLLQGSFIVINLICFSKCRVTRELRSVQERSRICAGNLPLRTREISNVSQLDRCHE